MKKIPTIFKRNPENIFEISKEPHPDCLWVFQNEGVATRKYDGSCCMVRDGVLYKRRSIKKRKPVPFDFEEVAFDENTGKKFGWVPVDFESKADKYHAKAWKTSLQDGTYELLGPKVQGNPEYFADNFLLRHSEAQILSGGLRTFDWIQSYLAASDIEGIVYHHPDGRMAKITKRHFGLPRVPAWKQKKEIENV